jgi:modification methylase
VNTATEVDRIHHHSAEAMPELPDNSVALMVTSPPYHVGKDYDSDGSFEDYLALLRRVFSETYRVLEPGGRAVVNVANLGRRPYISLSSRIVALMEDIGYLMRGEVIWRKAKASGGSTAWGSWMSASNPIFRDVHEYCLAFSKGRFQRVRKGTNTIERDEFLEATLSVWEMNPESARSVGHPAPFPVALPRRFIELFTYESDLVLDPFMGSGTTAIAALDAGRHYIGYETSEEYVALAAKRIAARPGS